MIKGNFHFLNIIFLLLNCIEIEIWNHFISNEKSIFFIYFIIQFANYFIWYDIAGRTDFGGIDNAALDFSQLEDYINDEEDNNSTM